MRKFPHNWLIMLFKRLNFSINNNNIPGARDASRAADDVLSAHRGREEEPLQSDVHHARSDHQGNHSGGLIEQFDNSD